MLSLLPFLHATCYILLSRTKLKGVSKSLEIDVEPEIPVQTPDAPRPNPPPKVVVDTGAPAPIQPKVQSTPTKKSKGVGTENGVIQEVSVFCPEHFLSCFHYSAASLPCSKPECLVAMTMGCV